MSDEEPEVLAEVFAAFAKMQESLEPEFAAALFDGIEDLYED